MVSSSQCLGAWSYASLTGRTHEPSAGHMARLLPGVRRRCGLEAKAPQLGLALLGVQGGPGVEGGATGWRCCLAIPEAGKGGETQSGNAPELSLAQSHLGAQGRLSDRPSLPLYRSCSLALGPSHQTRSTGHSVAIALQGLLAHSTEDTPSLHPLPPPQGIPPAPPSWVPLCFPTHAVSNRPFLFSVQKILLILQHATPASTQPSRAAGGPCFRHLHVFG